MKFWYGDSRTMSKIEKVKDRLFIWKGTGRRKRGTTRQKGKSRNGERNNSA